MATSREGVGRLLTSTGQQCSATYALRCWLEASGEKKTEGTLTDADPDVAMEAFRPGAVAELELGTGETVGIEITGILPGDEVIFVGRGSQQQR